MILLLMHAISGDRLSSAYSQHRLRSSPYIEVREFPTTTPSGLTIGTICWGNESCNFTKSLQGLLEREGFSYYFKNEDLAELDSFRFFSNQKCYQALLWTDYQTNHLNKLNIYLADEACRRFVWVLPWDYENVGSLIQV